MSPHTQPLNLVGLTSHHIQCVRVLYLTAYTHTSSDSRVNIDSEINSILRQPNQGTLAILKDLSEFLGELVTLVSPEMGAPTISPSLSAD